MPRVCNRVVVIPLAEQGMLLSALAGNRVSCKMHKRRMRQKMGFQ